MLERRATMRGYLYYMLKMFVAQLQIRLGDYIWRLTVTVMGQALEDLAHLQSRAEGVGCQVSYAAVPHG